MEFILRHFDGATAMKTIFLTGATGFLGRNLVQRILLGDPSAAVITLIRGGSQGEVEQRFEKLVHWLAPEVDPRHARKRILALRGDITSRALGLPLQLYREVARRVTHIVHSAASVKFQESLERAWMINVAGTQNVLEFAALARETGSLHHLAHVSTAYVSGTRRGVIYEDDLDCGQGFSNTYEETKFEAEKLVRRYMTILPVTVFRPSIIVGDSRTGRTLAFNVLYVPMKLLSQGVIDSLPGSRHTKVDVVPVDYVSDAIAQIFLKSDAGGGETYHITAGRGRETTSGEVADLTVEFFNRHAGRCLPQAKFVPPELFLTSERCQRFRAQRVAQCLRMYAPYMDGERHFDNACTASALGDTGIEAPRFETYVRALLRYCADSDWGKRLKASA